MRRDEALRILEEHRDEAGPGSNVDILAEMREQVLREAIRASSGCVCSLAPSSAPPHP